MLPEPEAVERRPSNLERLAYLDGLRGLAALIVLVGHFMRSDPEFLYAGSWHDAPRVIKVLWPLLTGRIWVFLFFILSAFSLSLAEDSRRRHGEVASVRTYARRRFWRIAPMYYVTFAVGLFIPLLPTVDAVRNNPMLHIPKDASWPGAISHVFFVHNLSTQWQFQGDAPLWTMAYEVQMYALFPLLYLAMRRYQPLFVLAAVVGLTVASRALIDGVPILGLLPCFGLGAMLSRVRGRFSRRTGPWFWAAGLATAVVGVFTLQPAAFGVLTLNDTPWVVAFGLLFVAMDIMPGGRWNPGNWRPLRWLGDRSYSVYTIHWIVLEVLVVLIAPHIASPRRLALVMVVVGFPLTLALGAVTYRFIERPGMRRMRGPRPLPAALPQHAP